MAANMVSIAKQRPMYGAGSWRDCSLQEWEEQRETALGIPVMDALRAMGDGDMEIGPHRFRVVGCTPFEKPHGVIVCDMNDLTPTKTWAFDDLISPSGDRLRGYELVNSQNQGGD